MSQAPDWELHYQQGSIGWDRGQSSPNLMQWIDSGELTPCRILVPGCGNGYEVLTLAEKGFDVVCVDIAPSAIANLRKALKTNSLSAETIESDFFSLDFSSKSFDAIYEQTCLCALQPSQWHPFERWLYESLKTGGKLYSHFMQTHQEGGPPFHCDMNEMKRLFAGSWQWLSERELQALKKQSDKMEVPCLLQKI